MHCNLYNGTRKLSNCSIFAYKLCVMLFCCATDWLMRHCNCSFGIEVETTHLTDINYADDAVLSTDNSDNWASVLYNFEVSSNAMGLHTSWLKTKIQNVRASAAPNIIHIDNQAVESVSNFAYGTLALMWT